MIFYALTYIWMLGPEGGVVAGKTCLIAISRALTALELSC